MPSYAGNSLGTATYLSIDAGLKSFTDHIDTIQTDGYYRFNFSASSSLNLVIDGLSANADVSLLDSGGSLIASSKNTGLLAESINTTLRSGTYYIKVSGVSGADTDYNLSVQTSFTTDILLRDTSTGVNAIWGMGGTGRTAVIGGGLITDGNGNVLALSNDFSMVGTADFTGDGIPDILLYNKATGLTAIWGMGGSNHTEVVSGGLVTDGSGTPLALSSDFSIVGIADFTRDGTPDILLYNKATGLSAIWGMGGPNNTQVVGGGLITDGNGTPLALSSSFSLVGIADFNLDGIPDIVLHNSDTGLTAVWGMGGHNNTQVVGGGLVTDGSGTPLALPSTTVLVGIADFNRDGIPDILLRNNVTGLNAIWGMGGSNNTQVVGGGLITDGNGTPLALSSSYVFAAIDDFTQDGVPDILLRNKDTGLNAIWGMGGNGGTAVVSGGLITDGGGTPLALSSNFAFPGTINRALPIDVAGDDTSTAFDVGTLNGTGIYKDTVDDIDYSDFYKFTITGAATRYSLLLDGLTGNADFELLNSSGTLLQSSANAGTAPEQIIRLLAAGDYYLHVYTLNGSAKYNLHLSNSTVDLQGALLNTPASIIAGQSFNADFKVQNTGITASGGFTVSFYLSTDNTIDTSDQLLGSYNAASLAGGATSANLIQNLTLPATSDPFWNNNPGTYYIGMIVDSQGTVNEISESNNSNVGFNLDYTSADVSLTDIDLVGVTSGFNLKTLSNTEMTKGFAGQQFTAEFQIKNAGTTDTNAGFTVAFYISKDSQIDASDKLLGTYDINDVSSLIAGGNTGTLTQSLTLPPIGDAFWNGVLTADYYIGMLIDSNDTVFETTETNNSSVAEKTDYVKATISQNAVDLRGVTSGFTVTDQDPNTSDVDVSAGDKFDFNFSLENIGNTDSNPFKVAFYISKDNKYTYDPVDDRLLSISSDPNTPFYYDYGSLAAGSSTGPLNLQQLIGDKLILPGVADEFWSQVNGTYYIGMIVDADPNNPNTLNNGVIDEVDELNNYSTGLTTDLDANYAKVNITGSNRVDLQGEGTFSASTSSGSANSTVDVTFQVKNYGNIDATKFRVGFYLSKDTTINPVVNGSQPADVFIGALNPTEAAKFKFDSGLAAGATSGAVTVTLKMPSTLPYPAGTYYLGMYVDSLGLTSGSSSGDVAEIDETNNGTKYVTFTIS